MCVCFAACFERTKRKKKRQIKDKQKEVADDALHFHLRVDMISGDAAAIL